MTLKWRWANAEPFRIVIYILLFIIFHYFCSSKGFVFRRRKSFVAHKWQKFECSQKLGPTRSYGRVRPTPLRPTIKRYFKGKRYNILGSLFRWEKRDMELSEHENNWSKIHYTNQKMDLSVTIPTSRIIECWQLFSHLLSFFYARIRFKILKKYFKVCPLQCLSP